MRENEIKEKRRYLEDEAHIKLFKGLKTLGLNSLSMIFCQNIVFYLLKFFN